MMNSKKFIGAIFLLSLLIVSCGTSEEQMAIALAQTIEADELFRVGTEVALSLMATDTIEPTRGPTNTPWPTPTSEPLWDPVPISEIETALSDEGYQREPIMTDTGFSGFIWTKDNVYERVVTWEDGMIELQVLHDKSPQTRAQHMERKFRVLDNVLPTDFMAALREENDAYNGTVASRVSGEPEDLYNWGGSFKSVEAEYYVSGVDIDGYTVWWSLWFNQSTCPAKYLYCYWPGFPGLEFTGDSSFTFYTILLEPIQIAAPSSSG